MRLLAVVLLSSLFASSFLQAAAPAAGKTIEAGLGKDFRLQKGETARIDGGRASLRITGFVNSPCPKGAYCAWSGLAVNSELTVGGKVVQEGSKDAPYSVDVKESDYRTYAVFLVDTPELACSRLEFPAVRGECLRRLAGQRGDPGLCRAITDARTRGFCLEDLAEELRKDELCREIAAPSQYCLYLKSKAAGALAACDGVVLWTWRLRCFKELSTEGGGGPHSCAELAPELAKRCRELALGPDR